MKYFSWSHEKNERLRRDRNISFEEVIFYIEAGQLLNIIENPNQVKYAGQKVFIVNINDYAYLIPFIESDLAIFLITIIPSRKATQRYLRGKK